MGRGSRPDKAKTLVLVPGTVAEDTVAGPAAGGGQATVGQSTATASAIAPQSPPPPPAPPEPAPEPTLAELQALRDLMLNEHPDWYPQYRDSFGHQFDNKLVPQLVGLSALELGLPAHTDPDRVRREVRAMAFARSYLMAQAGDVEGLRQVSEDLLDFWDDKLEGKLLPPIAVSRDDPAPWVHTLNRIRSRSTTRLDKAYGNSGRFHRFVTAVKGWTDGRWRELRSAAKRVLQGEAHSGGEHEAAELIEAIRAASPEAPRLWRKEKASDVAQRMGVSRHALLSHLQKRIGDELTQDLVSTSSRSDVWSGDFLWEIEPGAQAIHAYPLSWYPSESEWITAGEFRVLAVEPDGTAGVKVRVQQTGVFKEKKEIT